MKAITILQPWASLIACGAKKIETRSWATKYRGKIAIHAGAAKKPELLKIALYEPFWTALKDQQIPKLTDGRRGINFNLGEVIAIADLVDCIEMTEIIIACWKAIYGENEIKFGDFEPGRYGWILENVQVIDPIPARGQQRIWNWAGEAI